MFIAEWQWGPSNEDEMARHGLHPETVYQVWEIDPRYRGNKSGRSSSHQMVGPDRGGALWVICIKAIDPQEGLWRAITGWRGEPEDEEWYRRSR